MEITVEYEEVDRSQYDQQKCIRPDQIENQQSAPKTEETPQISETASKASLVTSESKSPKTANTTKEPNAELSPKACQSNKDKIEELSKKRALEGRPLFLRRWREYDIKVVVVDRNKRTSKPKVFRHNTFLWECPGTCQQIGQK